MSTMLITQALDERDLLAKKINDAIRNQIFLSAKKKGKTTDINNADVEKITEDIKSTYQSITDMISRYCMIIQKIAESNATTKINVDGREYTISAAISIIKDINTGTFFEGQLLGKLERDFNSIANIVAKNNNSVEANKQTLLNTLMGKDSSKKPSDTDIDYVDKIVEKDWFEFIDPLDIVNKIKDLRTSVLDLKAKLLSAIKISNATTLIELD